MSEAGRGNKMQDAWRAYLELAFGLTEASRKKAKKVARDVVGKGGTTAAQLQALAEDLLSTSRKNREGLSRLVRYEVDRALGALGLASAEEVGELNNRIRELERQVRVGAERPPPAATAGTGPAQKTVARKTVAKKTVAKKAAPAKTATKSTAAKATAATSTTARATAAKTTAAKSTAATSPAAKKATE
jgi:polyhydroxyalkanoate synthesis regulator phasin